MNLEDAAAALKRGIKFGEQKSIDTINFLEQIDRALGKMRICDRSRAHTTDRMCGKCLRTFPDEVKIAATQLSFEENPLFRFALSNYDFCGTLTAAKSKPT